jgi:hypothetical protein
MKQLLVVISTMLALVGLAPVQVHSQAGTPGTDRAATGQWFVDYFLSHNRLSSNDGEVRTLDGVGGRMMWSLAPLAGSDRGSLLARTAAGGYLVHTPGDADGNEMWHYGAQADVRVTIAPLAGRVEPLVSLGLGTVRMDEPGEWVAVTPEIRITESAARQAQDVTPMPVVLPALPQQIQVLSPPRSTRQVSVAPGIGARVRLLPGVNIRGDMRVLFDINDHTRRTTELAGGFSMNV